MCNTVYDAAQTVLVMVLRQCCALTVIMFLSGVKVSSSIAEHRHSHEFVLGVGGKHGAGFAPPPSAPPPATPMWL